MARIRYEVPTGQRPRPRLKRSTSVLWQIQLGPGRRAILPNLPKHCRVACPFWKSRTGYIWIPSLGRPCHRGRGDAQNGRPEGPWGPQTCVLTFFDSVGVRQDVPKVYSPRTPPARAVTGTKIASLTMRSCGGLRYSEYSETAGNKGAPWEAATSRRGFS
jgi:hypothetical protein